MTLKSMHYGMEFADQFAREANRVRFDEVLLFRALRKAILATSPCFPVEELHGARSRVVFPACPPWTRWC